MKAVSTFDEWLKWVRGEHRTNTLYAFAVGDFESQVRALAGLGHTGRTLRCAYVYDRTCASMMAVFQEVDSIGTPPTWGPEALRVHINVWDIKEIGRFRGRLADAARIKAEPPDLSAQASDQHTLNREAAC